MARASRARISKDGGARPGRGAPLRVGAGEPVLDLEVRRTLPGARELAREAAQVLRARVLRPVDAVAEAGELVLALDGLVDERFDVVRRADLVEHAHRPVRRAA